MDIDIPCPTGDPDPIDKYLNFDHFLETPPKSKNSSFSKSNKSVLSKSSHSSSKKSILYNLNVTIEEPVRVTLKIDCSKIN